MSKYKIYGKDIIFTICVLSITFLGSFILQCFLKTQSISSDIFILGVFIISLNTQGYLWGILASMLSVLAVNFAFTFPYFQFDFEAVESLLSAIAMLIVATVTSTLTTKIKEQERAKRENERERMRANLLRAISHDLRTPLTTIYGSCSAIIENYDSLKKEQQIKLLGEISEDAEWLIRMVENLLSITRIGSESVQVIKTPTVLEELIDSTLIKFHKRYPDQDIEVKIPEEFISIPMDPLLIQQVLINILENAVFHAKGMTELIFEVQKEGKWIVFTILDNGCGIPEDQLNKIFDGYLSKTGELMDDKRNNMSIGLSVCATIIKAHGGTIQAKNRKEGGACFSFSLEMEEIDE